MNFLALMQQFCAERGLPVPNAVMTATETTAIQLRALAQKVLMGLRQYEWQRQTTRVTFTSVATESQGTLATCFGSTYRSLVPGSVWDNDLRRPIFGPVGDPSWQILKAFIPAGPTYQYRVQGDEFLVNPTLEAGHTISAIVTTTSGCTDSTGATAKEYFTADTDIPVFPDEVFLTQLEWRWLKQKEQPWTASYQEAQAMLANALNKDSSKPTFDLGQPMQDLAWGIFVPAGNWNV